MYPNIFDLCGLKSELNVFYHTSAFRGKSPHEWIKFLKGENLHQPFKQIFQLARLTATIPATTSSVERSFSALKRIKLLIKDTSKLKIIWTIFLCYQLKMKCWNYWKQRKIFIILNYLEYNLILRNLPHKTQKLDYIYKWSIIKKKSCRL